MGSNSHLQTLSNPTTLVIFGASGNLAQIKLFPALYELLAYGHLPERLSIVAIFRQSSAALDTVMSQVEVTMLRQHRECDPAILARLKSLIRPIIMDSTNQEDYYRLRDMLDGIDHEFSVAHQRIFYLAIPPSIFKPVIACLGAAELNKEYDGVARRIFIEKPFGSDLASARDLIDSIKTHFEEHQIYRIDHYLAKETVQNILTFRFQNPLIRSIWNRDGIDYIHIRAFEKIDIEGRSDFYESLGALRDLLQSHLLQLMALIMMDAPTAMESHAIHEQKNALLGAIKLPTEPIDEFANRGQYEGYREEVNNPESQVETYAIVKLGVDLPEWHGVPVVLETGKALDHKDTSIEVVFRDRHNIDSGRNTLTIHVQPDEGIELQLTAKSPGFGYETRPVSMNFSYNTAFEGKNPEAYERVLFDAIAGDQTLFSTSAEVLACWEILEPIIQTWRNHNSIPESYTKGSEGPVGGIGIRKSVTT